MLYKRYTVAVKIAYKDRPPSDIEALRSETRRTRGFIQTLDPSISAPIDEQLAAIEEGFDQLLRVKQP